MPIEQEMVSPVSDLFRHEAQRQPKRTLYRSAGSLQAILQWLLSRRTGIERRIRRQAKRNTNQ